MKVYKQLKRKAKLKLTNVNLQSVNDEHLEVKGRINLDFDLNGIKLNHDCYAVKNVNGNLNLEK